MTTPRPIRLLPPAVAERIAAGEVIERPASVVKELVENSLDAGATRIEVALEDGGRTLIEITDDGSGMDAESLPLAVLRHATSKIGSLEDLDRISSLGFRGEALASIAAVAELEVISRPRGADSRSAHRLRVALDALETGGGPELGPATFGLFAGGAHGTRVSARGLFSRVPARLKFLRAPGAEVSQVRETLERLAAGSPGTAWRLTSHGRVILDLPIATEAERIRALLAPEGAVAPLVSGDSEASRGDHGLRARVYWLQGLSLPHSRHLLQLVNGRAVRDRLLQAALLRPFRQLLLPGQFPALALALEVDPAAVDVNVHPTKAEVRFLDSRAVFSVVDDALSRLLAREGAPAYAAAPRGSVAPFVAMEGSTTSGWRSDEGSTTSHWRSHEPRATPPPGGWLEVPVAPSPASDSTGAPDLFSAGAPAPGSPAIPEYLARASFSGTLFRTYLAYENDAELVCVDQHAAHERVRFERLRESLTAARRDGRPPDAQALLLPEVARVPDADPARISALVAELEGAGFECEPFGEDTLLFRAVPLAYAAGARGTSLTTRLQGLVERLMNDNEPEGPQARSGFRQEGEIRHARSACVIDEAIFESLASEACHGSTRAGDRLEALERETLIRDLFRCENPWNCPHGRPTVVRIPRARLEEWFQRRV